jgi:hypothetical protein
MTDPGRSASRQDVQVPDFPPVWPGAVTQQEELHPLNVRIDDDRPDNRPDVLFPYDFTTEFRTHDGRPIRQLHFQDMSRDPRYWDYDGSCRAWLTISWNVPDDANGF